MAHVQESQHWYDRQGNPVYQVPSADGKSMVNPDIRHARKLGLLPGFTSVNKVLYSFGLERYKIRQGILAALTLPRNEGEDDESYFKRLDEDRQAHAKGRAAEGTDLHKAIEQFLRGETYDTRWHPHVSNTVKLLHTLGQNFVADFKSKETCKGKKDYELFYDDHIMQLACYKRGVARKLLTVEYDGRQFSTETTFGHPLGYGGKVDCHSGMVNGGAALVSIIIPVDDASDIRHKVWTQEEEQRGLDMFDSALRLWCLKNRYDSSWRA